jgi:gliding motility-associated lipoprotein GldD
MNKSIPILLTLFALSAMACNTPYSPRPKGYFRIDFPEHRYKAYDQPGFPYSFEYPVYGNITRDSSLFDGTADNPYWINVDFPRFNGRIYISYKTIGGKSVYKIKTAAGYKDSLIVNTFDGLRDEAYKMTFKHSLKASGIVDSAFQTSSGIQGVYFNVEGNAATSRQFFVTDSSHHFLRGALYFDAAPNSDSLGVVNEFLEQDMKHLISTLRWK